MVGGGRGLYWLFLRSVSTASHRADLLDLRLLCLRVGAAIPGSSLVSPRSSDIESWNSSASEGGSSSLLPPPPPPTPNQGRNTYCMYIHIWGG